jgi:hypothetical protein
MAASADRIPESAFASESFAGGPAARKTGASGSSQVLRPWLRAQVINVTRHTAALRPFKREEFGNDAAAPSEGHIQAVNTLMNSLRQGLIPLSKRVGLAAKHAISEPSAAHLTELVSRKDYAQRWVQATERIWDFYFELFGQRQGNYREWLLSCDRIALDCYQVAYMGLGASRSVPAPPPFCYMRTGFAPATFRRGIPLARLGRRRNPFPLVQLPYHRLVNPWTLGAMLHETSHNLQSDLGLSRDIPRKVGKALLEAGFPQAVAFTWTRWNREMFADMSALLLGGPGAVPSLMDVVGRAPEMVLAYNPRVPHPTPYLRTLISVELLRRMGFEREAQAYRYAWKRIYPNPEAGNIPASVLETFPDACRRAVDAMCFQPYPSLGNKSLAQVIRFQRKDQQMIEESARRLAAGVDPGIVPARFLIGAARFAVDSRLAPPAKVAENFYKELSRR